MTDAINTCSNKYVNGANHLCTQNSFHRKIMNMLTICYLFTQNGIVRALPNV